MKLKALKLNKLKSAVILNDSEKKVIRGGGSSVYCDGYNHLGAPVYGSCSGSTPLECMGFCRDNGWTCLCWWA